jgi:hypothetical protein
LHKSQVQAYQQSAQKALIEWVNSVPLEPIEENDSEDSFVERCVTVIGHVKIPDWKLDDLQPLVSAEVHRRAKATYAKYHPDEDPEDGDEGEEEEDDDGEEGDEGEEEDGADVMGEDGADVMGEDGAVSGEEAKTDEATAPKKTATATTFMKKAAPGNRKPRVTKGKTTVQKKGVAAAKKGANARGQGARKGAAATRGRRRPANNPKSTS